MASPIDLPAELLAARSALKPLNLAQALRDIAAVLVCFVTGVAIVSSVPLALFLMIFCSFG